MPRKSADLRQRQAFRQATREYLRQIWIQRKFSIAGLLLPGIGSILIFYVPPLIVAHLINVYGSHRPTLNDIMPTLLLFGGVWLLGEILWRIAFLCLNRVDSRGMENLLDNALERLTNKDIDFFHNNFAGSLTKKAIGYGKSFEPFMDTLSFNVAANLIPLIFAFVILWRISPWLVWTLAGLMLMALLVIIPLIVQRKKLVTAREVASNKMAGHIADVIGNMDAVQAFAHSDHELKRHRSLVGVYMKSARESWDFHTIRIDAAISPLYVLTNVIGLGVAMVTAPAGQTISAVFVTFSYYSFATRVLWEFNRIYKNIESSLTEAAQFTELLLDDNAVIESPDAGKLVVTKGAVKFRDVDFSYDSNKLLFNNLQLDIAPGERIALVGHSGGGKTTITKLLLRFADTNKGSVEIDGQDISTVTLKDLRAAIAYVPQEPLMFHRTIRDNIRYGKLHATQEDVEQAARRAHAHDFIQGLPEGYDTLIGERGVKLSGGQRQRLAIARALIKDASILVLDEATSALDSESERLIQSALWELMAGRTAIVIAHRLSTIQRMDRIIVLDNGKIAEQGTHTELLQRKGIYATLWAHQSGGFIEE